MFGARTVTRWSKEDLRGDSRPRLLARVLRSAVRHRTSGHAAEMAFFAVLTLVPSTVAVGAALGFSERFIGRQAVADAESEAAAGAGVRARARPGPPPPPPPPPPVPPPLAPPPPPPPPGGLGPSAPC